MTFLDVAERLASLGVSVDENEAYLISYIIRRVSRDMAGACNLEALPDELTENAIDRCAGEYLFEKKAVEPESLKGFDLEAAVRKVSEGDTAIEAVGVTPEERLDRLIAALMGSGGGKLAGIRRLVW